MSRPASATRCRPSGAAPTSRPRPLSVVYLTDGEGRLVGSASVVALLRAEQDRPLGEIAERDPQCAQTDEELPEVARLMADFNLMALPVVDEAGKLVGVVTVDDVLELLVPEEWRGAPGRPGQTAAGYQPSRRPPAVATSARLARRCAPMRRQDVRPLRWSW